MTRASTLFALVGGVDQLSGAHACTDRTELFPSIVILGSGTSAVATTDDHRSLGFHHQFVFASSLAYLAGGLLMDQVRTARTPATSATQGQLTSIAINDGCGILGQGKHMLG